MSLYFGCITNPSPEEFELHAGRGILGKEVRGKALAHRAAPPDRYGPADRHAASPRRSHVARIRVPRLGLRLRLGSSRTPPLLARRYPARHSSCDRSLLRSSPSSSVLVSGLSG